jgi:hypothetical protein
MERSSFVRLVVVVLSLLVGGRVVFPSFPITGLPALTSAALVDRSMKSDRLPLDLSADKTEMPLQSAPLSDTVPMSNTIPIGCDRAFSPISAPRLANVFRRCAA